MNKAIYCVIEQMEGFVKVEMLGDGSAMPVVFTGRNERDALGYRTDQYEEIIRLSVGEFNAEVARRKALFMQMAWKG